MTGSVQYIPAAATPFHYTVRILSNSEEEYFTNTQPFLNPLPLSHTHRVQ
jgi:hypothetical protein